MKQIFLFASATFLLFSCNESQSKLNREQYDSLVSVIYERDESITHFANSLNDVEQNLDSITVKQHVIFLNYAKSGEFSASQKTRINNEIKAINFLMKKNIVKIDELTKKLNASSTKNTALEKTIKTITNQLAQKQKELENLNNTLSSLNGQVEKLESSVDMLTSQNGIQADIIDYTISELQTAYYVIGKSKTLLDAKIIDKKGGLLGIGKTTKISADVDTKYFTKIDFTNTMSFPINSKGASVITNHPSKSYILETDIDNKEFVKNLVVINPDLFWSASKYLVVVIK